MGPRLEPSSRSVSEQTNSASYQHMIISIKTQLRWFKCTKREQLIQFSHHSPDHMHITDHPNTYLERATTVVSKDTPQTREKSYQTQNLESNLFAAESVPAFFIKSKPETTKKNLPLLLLLLLLLFPERRDGF